MLKYNTWSNLANRTTIGGQIMDIFLLVAAVFWMGMGTMTIKREIEKGNKKLLNITLKDGAIIMLKSLFYGPYTKSKLLAKM
ncbi:MAG TPA: hypothetical protein VK255_02520 [Patescibacteria group bacterium]|nr:hypothetical protein [Patescibacteria group bacterium]